MKDFVVDPIDSLASEVRNCGISEQLLSVNEFESRQVHKFDGTILDDLDLEDLLDGIALHS